MNAYEEDMQRSLEGGQIPEGEELDVKAYRQVFRVLEKDPGFHLSPEFASRIVARVKSQARTRDSRDYFWFGAGIFFLVITSLATILKIGFQFDFGFLKAMSDYKGLAVFGIVFILFLNWLDKRLVRDRHVQQRESQP